MSFEFLSKYAGKIKVNGQVVSRLRVLDFLQDCSGDIEIKLIPEGFVDTQDVDDKADTVILYDVYVKSYMLNTSTDDFNFMRVWNDDVPMPLRLMRGEILQESRSMYKMKLNGIVNKTICSRCGRELYNATSKIVGIGPECASVLGVDVSMFNKQASEQFIKEMEQKIRNTVWEGWVPKTAILTLKESTND